MLVTRRTIVIWHDILMIGSAWMLAWLIRFNFDIPAP
jgi:hypothetical protein